MDPGQASTADTSMSSLILQQHKKSTLEAYPEEAGTTVSPPPSRYNPDPPRLFPARPKAQHLNFIPYLCPCPQGMTTSDPAPRQRRRGKPARSSACSVAAGAPHAKGWPCLAGAICASRRAPATFSLRRALRARSTPLPCQLSPCPG